LQSAGELDLELTQRVDHLILQQRQLIRVAEDVRVDPPQLLDRAIEFFREIAVAAQRPAQLFGLGEPLAQFAFKLTRAGSWRTASHACSLGVLLAGLQASALLLTRSLLLTALLTRLLTGLLTRLTGLLTGLLAGLLTRLLLAGTTLLAARLLTRLTSLVASLLAARLLARLLLARLLLTRLLA